MTIAGWLFSTLQKLGKSGVDSPRRDAFVLLEDVLTKDRAWVNAHGEHELSARQLATLNWLVERRINHEPLAYIRGKAWFYGRFFNVTPDVMIPRPESESFIEFLKQITKDNVKGLSFHIVDVGTGSGCLAVTAKLELPDIVVVAIDSSQKALEIAAQNAKKHGVKIEFLQGHLLDGLASSVFDLSSTIIANLPYVPDGMITSPEITYEPAGALFSGPDGLDHYRQFWQQVISLKSKPQYIMTESLETQHKELAALAQKAGYKLIKTDVLVQLFSA